MTVWWQAPHGATGSDLAADDESSSSSCNYGSAPSETSGSEPGAAVPSRAGRVYERAKRRHKRGYAEYPGPDGKAGQMKHGCAHGEPEDCPFIERLKWDLANSYHWTGNFCRDYAFFVTQWHSLLGIFLSHPNHPWSKRDRLLMMTLSLALNAMPAAWLAELQERDRLRARGYGADSEDPVATWSVFFFITIPDIIWGVIMYQASVADTRCKWFPSCRPCMHGLKRCVFCWFAVIVVLCVLGSRLILGDIPWQDAIVPLAKGKALSFVVWFPLWMLLPCRLGFLDLWSVEHRGEDEEVPTAHGEGLTATQGTGPSREGSLV